MLPSWWSYISGSAVFLSAILIVGCIAFCHPDQSLPRMHRNIRLLRGLLWALAILGLLCLSPLVWLLVAVAKYGTLDSYVRLAEAEEISLLVKFRQAVAEEERERHLGGEQ